MNKLKFNIYRKPTTTDTTIHADSHHPLSHKMAAYNNFIHRLLTVPLDDNDFRDELNVIKYIAVANGYNSLTIDKLLDVYKRQFLQSVAYKIAPLLLCFVQKNCVLCCRFNNKLCTLL